MTLAQLAELPGFSVANLPDPTREVTSIYCCDLLSIVMGRAPADSAWITVMGNLNAVAVAVLADTACVVLAEGMALDPTALEKARQQQVALLTTTLPVYEAARAIASLLEGGSR